MENYKKKAIRFLVNLSLKEERDPRVVKYAVSKTKISKREEKHLVRNIGGTGGKYARTLTSMLSELEKEARANVHSIMVFKDGEVVCEASAAGYDTNIFHLAHSMSKTVTALAIGFLYDESKINLDSPAIDFFPEIKARGEKIKKITLRHLLLMQSGVKFAEIGVVSESQWTKAFFESELEFTPGERFHYNSMNSYILSAVATRIAGKSLSELVNEKLFAPLGIENYLWEKGPEGTEKGGFGLYLSCESFLKIGILLASGGKFGKKRIISEEFLSLMLTPHVPPSETKSEYGYGLHVWVSGDGEELLLNGMLGQNVWASKKSGFVVSMSSGNNELFTESPALAIIKKHLLRSLTEEKAGRSEIKLLREASESFFTSRESVSLLKERRGLPYVFGIKKRRPFDIRWDSVLGEYAFRSNNASILPLFVRIMQNNFLGGIEKISLLRSDEALLLSSTEGGISHEIPIGLYGFADSVLNFGGEKYIVRARGEYTVDEDKKTVYKIEVKFPELPNTRLIKISASESEITVAMSEFPNERIAESFFEFLSSDAKTALAISLIEKKMGDGFFKEKIHTAFNPTLNGISTKSYGWESIITRDNLKLAEERENKSKFINSLISKFLSDKNEARDKSSDGLIKGFFGKALSFLLEKLRPDANTEAENSSTIEISDDIITFLNSQD